MEYRHQKRGIFIPKYPVRYSSFFKLFKPKSPMSCRLPPVPPNFRRYGEVVSVCSSSSGLIHHPFEGAKPIKKNNMVTGDPGGCWITRVRIIRPSTAGFDPWCFDKSWSAQMCHGHKLDHMRLLGDGHHSIFKRICICICAYTCIYIYLSNLGELAYFTDLN